MSAALFHRAGKRLPADSPWPRKEILTVVWRSVDNGRREGITLVSVLVIRAHKRFAVRRPVTLYGKGDHEYRGLMIELSCEGCRISCIDSLAFTMEQPVTLDLGDGREFAGRVRWAHDGFVGLKFARALRQSELPELIEACRFDSAQPRYGT